MWSEMIGVHGVSKSFPDFTLQEINLSVKEKEYLVLLGPTGAGKTLVLETIAGIYRPDKGRIFIDGADITDAPPGERHIGMVYQDYMLFPHLTLAQNIAFGLEARKKDSAEVIRQKVSDSAEMLAISHLLDRYPNTLSGGEQQRGAIARAIVTEPRVLLLDEPLSAVDESTTERLHLEFKRIHQLTGATTVHITHRFDEAYALADRIAIMNHGRIHQEGSPETLFRKPADRWVAQFVGCKNLLPGNAQRHNSLTRVQTDGAVFHSSTPLQGDVWVSIRPEDIYISRRKHNEPGVNSFTAKITGIVNRGRLIEAEVDAGIPLITALSRQSAQKVDLHPGKSVYITIRSQDVHLFKE